MTTATLLHWIVFNLVIFFLLGLDLWHFYCRPHEIKFKEALYTTLAWIAVALLCNGWIYYHFGTQSALNFLTGYLIELALSVDNLFIFLLVFSHFKVHEDAKHRVLFYGIIGAIIMRGILILAGVAFVERFEWAFYLFGAFLLYTGFKMAFSKEINLKIEENRVYRFLKSSLGVTETYHGQAFLIREGSSWKATPLLVVVLLIELADLVFALDSIPAIIGITTDLFIVYSSNILAVLGLRSLFFVLEGFMKRFYLLHYALAGILCFIGAKMLLAHVFVIPTTVSLLVILVLLALAVLGSYLFPSLAKSDQHHKYE